MTAMPQMVALYNGAGGGAAALISTVEYLRALGSATPIDPVVSTSLVLSAIIGAVSFAGSIIAFFKLQEVMTGRPITYAGQQIVNAIVSLAILGLGAWFIASARRVSASGGFFAAARSRAGAGRPLRSCRSAAPICRS